MENRRQAAVAVAEYRARGRERRRAYSMRAEWTRAAECCDALAQARRDELAGTQSWRPRPRQWADVAALVRAAAALRAVAAEQPE